MRYSKAASVVDCWQVMKLNDAEPVQNGTIACIGAGTGGQTSDTRAHPLPWDLYLVSEIRSPHESAPTGADTPRSAQKVSTTSFVVKFFLDP